MRTIRIKIYKFNELPTEKAKERARNWWREGLDDWWRGTYEGAENIGLSITSFDLDSRDIDGDMDDISLSARKIKTEHGETCPTCKLADQFLNEWERLVAKYSDGDGEKVKEGNEDEFDTEADELETQFKYDLLREYLKMLKQELEFQLSNENIGELLTINEYEFTEDGKIH